MGFDADSLTFPCLKTLRPGSLDVTEQSSMSCPETTSFVVSGPRQTRYWERYTPDRILDLLTLMLGA